MALDPRCELTTADVAARLGVHPRSVKRWASKGALAGVRIGGRWRFSQDGIDAFIASGANTANTTEATA